MPLIDIQNVEGPFEDVQTAPTNSQSDSNAATSNGATPPKNMETPQMFDFPNIMPADPRAPEHMKSPMQNLEYSMIARAIFWIAALRVSAPEFFRPTRRPTPNQQHITT